MGGSDPTLCGFQPPKKWWGRSRPSRLLRDRVLSACRDRSRQCVVQADYISNEKRRKSTWHYWKPRESIREELIQDVQGIGKRLDPTVFTKCE